MAWVVPQVVTAVAKTAAKIADITKRLVQALQKLSPLLKKLGDNFDEAGKALKNLKSTHAAGHQDADAPPAGTRGVDSPNGSGPTTPSSAPPTRGPDTAPPPRDGSGPTTPSGSNSTPDTGPSPTPCPGPGSRGLDNGPTTPSGGAPNKPSPPRDRAVGGDDRKVISDPVDVVTGEMIMTERDLELPGLLPLVLDRTHVSSYRAGRFFGSSWASTVDQRVEVDEQVHTDAAGSRTVTTWDYHPLDDRPLTQVEQAQQEWTLHSIVTDLIGTPTALIDAQGALTWQNRTTLWGQVVAPPVGAADTPLRFPGQYADPETRLHYNVFRYYDPATGRYVSQDPLGLGPAPNPVGYPGNPFHQADPLGLMCKGSGSGTPPNRPGAGTDPANVKKTPPPPPKKPDDLKGNPINRPSSNTPGNPVPDNAPNRKGAKTFGHNNATGEKYELSEDGTKVKVYRFGDQGKQWDWESKNRWNNDHNGFQEPNSLNDWAIKQSSFGSGSENAGQNPLISVATDPDSLRKSNDPWVQKILNESPDLRVMEVPPESLIRPKPTKPISKEETEWMFYDGDSSMNNFHSEWRPNPFKGKLS